MLSLEPALTLLMLLLFMALLISSASYNPSPYQPIVREMHKTDIYLVNDSIHYYGQYEQLKQKLEWAEEVTLIS